MDNTPQIIIRMGSHAEKEYILKLKNKAFDGIIIGANIVEATAGATASLVGKKLNMPYYIDPMTYVFGCDLDGIRTERKKKGVKKGETEISYKRSYESLANKFGTFFSGILESRTPVAPDNFPFSSIKSICQNVIDYQLNRIREEFIKDDDYKEYASSINNPACVFSPYFYIPYDYNDSLSLFLKLSETSANINPRVPVHSVLCADPGLLNNKSFIDEVVNKIPKTKIDGVWLWFSNFDEYEADEDSLRNFKDLVKRLSQNNLQIYNRHGGYFSLILNKIGMSGISHSIGYGEKKDVNQIKGPPNAPVVYYYLPDIYKRYGVDAIERCLPDLGIKTPEEFHESICGCIICKGVIKNNPSAFSDFGEMHYAKPTSKRPSQTPAAAKRCRYHFLMNRIMEKDFVSKNNLDSIKERLRQSKYKWNGFDKIIQFKHIDNWLVSLS